ncbi:farnesol dehydrogenase-like [Homalodisca vitripennis]|uniref:farnesol dehydrogenase-like n=1 Tax=Homalodisca vitripennis TaxID=197043 RepID=UPI001EEBA134|nr:farnesol dehydrogenase-like [Homalodisca vitripennis]KAG8277884.1 Dehydrogenase/reductase SDR member 11 [Homalodisca vitripennis]
MDQWKGKVAIVTGASAGIGAAIAQALVHHGMVVVGLARRQEKMQELAKKLSEAKEPGKLHAVKCDLTKEEDILAAFQWTDKELGGADVLVNNAGLAVLGHLQDGNTKDWSNMLNLNILALCISTREYLESMERRKNQHGHIININSVAGHIIFSSRGGVYAGTKHAVKAITQSLRRELVDKNSKIKVTSISPGITRTEMTGSNLDLLQGNGSLDPSFLAKAVVDTLGTSEETQVCEMIINAMPSKFVVY